MPPVAAVQPPGVKVLATNRKKEQGGSTTTKKKVAHGDERLKRLNEIVVTERQYVKELELLCETHQKALENVLTREEMNLLFGNVRELYQIHKMLLSKLGGSKTVHKSVTSAEESFGRVFEEMAPFLRAYTVYCKGYQQAIELASSPKLAKLLKGKDLVSLLIKPVQRLCKYPLFFEALLKHATGDTKRRIESALASVRDAVDAVNAAVKAAEATAMVVRIYENNFEKSPDLGTFVTPTRRFLARGRVTFEGDVMAYFLFNDLLLLADPVGPEKFTLAHRIALLDLQVKDAISLTQDNVVYLRYHNRTGHSYTTTGKNNPAKSARIPKLQDIDKTSLSLHTLTSSDSEKLRKALDLAASDLKTLHTQVDLRRSRQLM